MVDPERMIQNRLIEIQKTHHFSHVFRRSGARQQSFTVMKGKADQLITAIDNFLVAEAAGHRQWQIVLFRLLDQMQHSVEKVADFRGLPIQALGQQHSQLRCIDIQTTPDHSCVNTL